MGTTEKAKPRRIIIKNDSGFGGATQIIDEQTGNEIPLNRVASLDIHIGKKVEASIVYTGVALTDVAAYLVSEKINDNCYYVEIDNAEFDIRTFQREGNKTRIYFERRK